MLYTNKKGEELEQKNNSIKPHENLSKLWWKQNVIDHKEPFYI